MSEKDQDHQVVVAQNTIQHIQLEVNRVSAQVKEVHQALIGSSLGQDGGLVKRVKDLEGIQKELVDRLNIIDSNTRQRDFYIKIIWSMGGALIMAIFSLVLSYYFYHTTGTPPPKLK